MHGYTSQSVLHGVSECRNVCHTACVADSLLPCCSRQPFSIAGCCNFYSIRSTDPDTLRVHIENNNRQSGCIARRSAIQYTEIFAQSLQHSVTELSTQSCRQSDDTTRWSRRVTARLSQCRWRTPLASVIPERYASNAVKHLACFQRTQKSKMAVTGT